MNLRLTNELWMTLSASLLKLISAFRFLNMGQMDECGYYTVSIEKK